MPTHRRHGSRALAAAAMAAAALVTACSSSGSAPAQPSTPAPSGTTASQSRTATPQYDAVITVDVSNGKVSGDTGLQHVKKGQRVAIVVTSDVADEIHLHTYDIKQDVTA